MKRNASHILAIVATSFLFASPVLANKELARSKQCLSCHAIDKTVVGPAYKDVAARYAGQKDAAARLTERIMKGGSGNWGSIPMPANSVTPSEAKTLAHWVLTLK